MSPKRHKWTWEDREELRQLLQIDDEVTQQGRTPAATTPEVKVKQLQAEMATLQADRAFLLGIVTRYYPEALPSDSDERRFAGRALAAQRIDYNGMTSTDYIRQIFTRLIREGRDLPPAEGWEQ